MELDNVFSFIIPEAEDAINLVTEDNEYKNRDTEDDCAEYEHEEETDTSSTNITETSDKMGKKISDNIEDFLNSYIKENYGPSKLDLPVNPTQTLREYIIDSEETFNLPKKNLTNLDAFGIYEYILILDRMWCEPK